MFYFSIILRDTSEKGNKCGITNTFGKRNLKYFFFDEILLLDDDTDKDPNPTKNETFCSEFVTLHCTQSISLIVTYYTVQGIGFRSSTWAVLSLNCGHFLRDNASFDACKKY